jgi:hypothetical protein
MNKVKRYAEIVEKLLLEHKDLGFYEVKNIVRIKSFFLDKSKYELIVLLIKEKKWDELKGMAIPPNGGKEYVDVVTFNDQDNKLYVVTLFDSDALWQEFKLIDIFPLT